MLALVDHGLLRLRCFLVKCNTVVAWRSVDEQIPAPLDLHVRSRERDKRRAALQRECCDNDAGGAVPLSQVIYDFIHSLLEQSPA